MPSHTHTYSDYIRDASYGAQQAGASSYAVADAAQLFQTTNTGSAGGDQAHNNMQPYIVTYMWKRTA
jgi:microcystin-dependent protein